MSEFVPVIDINDLNSHTSLAAIDRACRDWGFFQVTGHGIDPVRIKELFAVAREFFSQSADSKYLVRRDADNPWGYYDKELTKNRQDLKEIYDFGPSEGDQLKPRWPPGAFGLRFEDALRSYYASCDELAMRLLSAVGTNLGVHPALLARSFGRTHSSFLRLNYYPQFAGERRREANGQDFGVGEHTDSGALTLLLQDDQPGLEVLNNGRWHLVEPRADALVINIGDIVQVWSNDQYRAALHRVVTNPTSDRYSIPFFLNPSYETEYEPLPTTVTSHQPSRYRSISWREFRKLRAAGDFADLGEEIQITHYRR